MIKTLNIKFGYERSIKVNLKGQFAEQEFAFTDIIDFAFFLKSDINLDDDEAEFAKYLNTGAITRDDSEERFYIPFDFADFGDGKLEKKGEYFICLGFKIASSTVFDEEIEASNYGKIKVLPDRIRS